jgi:hypothetical protein
MRELQAGGTLGSSGAAMMQFSNFIRAVQVH